MVTDINDKLDFKNDKIVKSVMLKFEHDISASNDIRNIKIAQVLVKISLKQIEHPFYVLMIL